MTKKQTQVERNNFETIVVPAIITATSNKVDGDFKQQVPTKTVYLHVPDTKKALELEAFGLTQYTPEADENGEAKPYFIVKATKDLKHYTDEENYTVVDFGIETPNLFTEEEIYVAIVFIKGEKGKNDFYRLNSILSPNENVLQEVEAVNPFAGLFAK